MQVVEFCCILPSCPCQAFVFLRQQLPAVERTDPNIGLRTGRHDNGHSDPQPSKVGVLTLKDPCESL